VGLPELWGLDPVVWFGVFNVVGLLAGIVVTSLLMPRLVTPAIALYGQALRHGGPEPELKEAKALA
jgi:hypothetical protein